MFRSDEKFSILRNHVPICTRAEERTRSSLPSAAWRRRRRSQRAKEHRTSDEGSCDDGRLAGWLAGLASLVCLGVLAAAADGGGRACLSLRGARRRAPRTTRASLRQARPRLSSGRRRGQRRRLGRRAAAAAAWSSPREEAPPGSFSGHATATERAVAACCGFIRHVCRSLDVVPAW